MAATKAKKKAVKRASVASDLRAAIKAAEAEGSSRYKIARTAGLSIPHVHRIADDEGTPRLDTAEKVLAALGLRLQIVAA
jgi:DNA-binding phage protein